MGPERLPSGVFFVTPDDFPSTFFPVFPHAQPAADTPGLINTTVVRPSVSPHVRQPRVDLSRAPNRHPSPSPPRPSQVAFGKAVHCLPLLDATIDVCVDCTITTTRFIQRFTNVSDVAIAEAHYTFPVYDGAVVASFRYSIGDSKVLVGKVLSNEEALREYIRAIEAMEAAALLDETTPEVFQTRMGNIPPKTSVKVEITYVSRAKTDGGGKGILVTIPTSIAPRYGTPPARYSGSSAMAQVGLSIVVRVTSGDPIRHVECRTHPASVEMGTAGPPIDLKDFETFMAVAMDAAGGKSKTTAFNVHQATIRLSDPNAKMDKDFVVFVNSHGDAKQSHQSQALLSPVNEHGQAALMVTINPSELFSTQKANMEFGGEIIFIADRSGSMDGEKISGLRSALHVFLKSLPDSCSFNVWSFGTSYSSLWPFSKQYNQGSLDEAVSHVLGFGADMGGTELLATLKDVVGQRAGKVGSTQIILLTDGQVWDTNSVIQFVQSARKSSGDAIRIFALGIGDSVSHRLVEGIGGAGGGFGEVINIGTPEKWQDRVIRMLKAALMPPSWNCEIDLGPQYTATDLCVDDLDSDVSSGRNVASNALSTYIQAPRSAMVHHFRQQTFFFLLDLRSATPPTVLTVDAAATASRAKVSRLETLPIESITTVTSAIQHLAAKAILLDLDMMAERQDFLDVGESENPVAARNAVLIGKRYSITSRWTCFVATDQHDGGTINPIDIYSAPIGQTALPQLWGAVPQLPTTDSRSYSSQAYRNQARQSMALAGASMLRTDWAQSASVDYSYSGYGHSDYSDYGHSGYGYSGTHIRCSTSYPPGSMKCWVANPNRRALHVCSRLQRGSRRAYVGWYTF